MMNILGMQCSNGSGNFIVSDEGSAYYNNVSDTSGEYNASEEGSIACNASSVDSGH